MTHLFIFTFVSFAFGDRSLPPKSCSLCQSVFCPFSSRYFVVCGLTFGPLIYFEFNFVYGIRECPNFILLHVAIVVQLLIMSDPLWPLDCRYTGLLYLSLADEVIWDASFLIRARSYEFPCKHYFTWMTSSSVYCVSLCLFQSSSSLSCDSFLSRLSFT